VPPALSFTLTGQDYLDMANGKLDPIQALMAEKFKIAGDMTVT
jgi:putative sterol carrier protein